MPNKYDVLIKICNKNVKNKKSNFPRKCAKKEIFWLFTLVRIFIKIRSINKYS